MPDIAAAFYGWCKGMSMSLQDKIRQDLKTALLQKDAATKDAIRMVMSEFPKLTVPITLESGKHTTRLKKPAEITDEDILDIIRKLVNPEKTFLELKKETSPDCLQRLEAYLPQLASKADIETWIGQNIDFSSYKSPLQAMGAIMKHFGKLADGNLVKQILQDKTR